MKPTLLILLAAVVMSTSTLAQPDRRKSLDQAVSKPANATTAACSPPRLTGAVTASHTTFVS